jgi:hypothetical protein
MIIGLKNETIIQESLFKQPVVLTAASIITIEKKPL